MAKKNRSPDDAADHVERLRAVLRALGIAHGTYVDDQFAPSFDSAWAQSRAMARLRAKELLALWTVGAWDVDSAEDDRVDTEKRWKFMDRAARRTLVKKLQALVSEFHLDAESPADVRFLRVFWPEDVCPLDEIEPEDFDGVYIRNSLLEKGPSILFLDLGFGDGDTNGGLRLLKKVIQEDSEGLTVCVVFTGHPEAGELEFWAELASSEGIDPERAVVISKGATGSIEKFEGELRRALLNWLAPELLKWAKMVADKALQKALAATRIEGDVLNAIVLQSSEKEGIDPGETLFRLIDGEVRRERDREAVTPEARERFAKLKERLEALATIGTTGLADPRLTFRVKELMRGHLYRMESTVADWPAPMWLGDLWKVTFETSEEVTFALIAQPCDIALRSGDGNRSQEWAILAPLTSKKGRETTTVQLQYFAEPNFDDRWADFKRARVANANVLDTVAMFGPRIERSKLAELRARLHVHSSVVRRIGHLVDWLESIPFDANAAARDLALFGSPGPVAKVESTPEVIEFHCRRIGRIEPECSRLLLQRYGDFVARHALPHDFARFRS